MHYLGLRLKNTVYKYVHCGYNNPPVIVHGDFLVSPKTLIQTIICATESL